MITMILFIQHIEFEGPDMLGFFFERDGFKTRILRLHDGERLPTNLDGTNAIVSLGGPMNVYEEDRFPFLADEHKFIKKVVKEEVPFLGICLGSQLLAKACGGKVGTSPRKEIGFYPVWLTQDGCEDPFFDGLGKTLEVFHWHEDMSELPSGATLLASSEGCPHQAFRVGACAYGLQFHVEVTRPTVCAWADAYFPADDPLGMRRKQTMLRDYQKKEKPFGQTAGTMYRNLVNIIRRAGRLAA